MQKVLIKVLLVGYFLISLLAGLARGEPACLYVFNNTSCDPSGDVYVIVRLTRPPVVSSVSSYMFIKSEGTFNVQPFISAGTFTLTYQWSDKIEMPTSDNDWGSETTIATGLTSSSHDCYALSPNGPHAWLRIKASETGGTGSPVITLSLCAD